MKGKDIVSNKIIDDVRLKYKLHGYSSLTELEKIQLVLSYSEINERAVEISNNTAICTQSSIQIFHFS